MTRTICPKAGEAGPTNTAHSKASSPAYRTYILLLTSEPTRWGFLQPGSTVPAHELPLISRTITLPYLSIVCRDAFNITEPSDIAAINKYGGYDIAYDRLAFVDGQDDPWRVVTPHSPAAPARVSSTERPFILIEGAVHHWDENGLFANETTSSLPPGPVADTQRAEVRFVKTWVEEAKKHFDN
jgi:hypothetical protein